MSFAMCMDGGMLIGILLTFLAIGAVCVTPIIFALVAFVRWADARHNRLAANAR